jgi:signal transduction histidine kinase
MQNQPLPKFAIFDDYRPTVAITVVVRWLLLATYFFLNTYRVEEDLVHGVLNLNAAVLALLNLYMTWRLVTGRPITWYHALTLSLADLIVITVGLFLRGGVHNDLFIFYYPALLGPSLMFPRRASFTIVVAVIALYIAMAFTASPTLNWGREEEKNLIVRTISMIGIVIAGSLITRWERSRRREAVAAERQRANENLELQRKAQQAELAALEERSRIAREIHDGIAQSLYMLNISLETCAELASREQNGLHQRLQSLVKVSRQALLDARYYIFDLKPLLDGNRSVTEMLTHQVQEFRTVTSIPTTLTVSGTEFPLPVAAGAGLYRIIQEGLANVHKHAQASQVEVRLVFGPEEVQLQINDNGQGFTSSSSTPPQGEEKASRGSGYGLGNIAARARELGGRLDIQSAQGQGTRLSLTLPVPAPSSNTSSGNER